jgi:hypothetical protein
MSETNRTRAAASAASPDSLARRRQGRITGLLVLAAVVLVDGSYALVVALDQGARLTLGSELPSLLVFAALPVVLSGALSFGMTRGSPTPGAGPVTAGIVATVSFVFAAMKLRAIGTYGNEMDGVVVVVEIGITVAVAVVVQLVALVGAAVRARPK